MDEQQDQDCRMSVVKEQVSSQRLVPEVKGFTYIAFVRKSYLCMPQHDQSIYWSLLLLELVLRFCSSSSVNALNATACTKSAE